MDMVLYMVVGMALDDTNANNHGIDNYLPTDHSENNNDHDNDNYNVLYSCKVTLFLAICIVIHEVLNFW